MLSDATSYYRLCSTHAYTQTEIASNILEGALRGGGARDDGDVGHMTDGGQGLKGEEWRRGKRGFNIKVRKTELLRQLRKLHSDSRQSPLQTESQTPMAE